MVEETTEMLKKIDKLSIGDSTTSEEALKVAKLSDQLPKVTLEVKDSALPMAGDNVTLFLDGKPLKMVQNFDLGINSETPLATVSLKMFANVEVLYRDKEEKVI